MPVFLGNSLELRDPEMRDLGPALDAAEAMGVEFAELPLPYLPVIRGCRVVGHRLASARAEMGGRRLRYALHGHLGINLMEDPYRIGLHLSLLQANIEVAAELGCTHLVIHAGFAPAGPAGLLDAALARQRARLARMGDVARDYGVTICVENVFDFRGQRAAALPGRLAQELAAVGHPNVAATFDLSHGWLHCQQAGADFLDHAAALSPHARHLHLHDSFGQLDDFWIYSPME